MDWNFREGHLDLSISLLGFSSRGDYSGASMLRMAAALSMEEPKVVRFFKNIDFNTNEGIPGAELAYSEVERSAFGRFILAYARETIRHYIESEDIRAIHMLEGYPELQPLEPESIEKVEKLFVTMFLNLSAWLIAPLLTASGFQYPFISEEWARRHIEEKEFLTMDEKMVWFVGVNKFISDAPITGWDLPVNCLRLTIGDDMLFKILAIFDLYRQAHESNQDSAEDRGRSAEAWADSMGSPFKDFIEGMEGPDSAEPDIPLCR